MKVFHDTGFEEVQIRGRHAIFVDVPKPSSALEFGTIGISLRATKRFRSE